MKIDTCKTCGTRYQPLYRDQPCPNCQTDIEDNEALYVPITPRLPVDYDRSIHKQDTIKTWKYTLTRTFMKGRYSR